MMRTKLQMRVFLKKLSVKKYCSAILSFSIFSVGATGGIFPEASDPVLDGRAAIVEWIWSSSYAQKYGLPIQADGLKNDYLQLLGIKIFRSQNGSGDAQTYRCRVMGLIDGNAPVIWPPGDRYGGHPGHSWIGGLPGKLPVIGSEQMKFVPAQATWRKRPNNERQKKYPERGIGMPYVYFHRYYSPVLAYFELEGGCAYFGDPGEFRNELRFPTRIDGKNDIDAREEAVFEGSALKFDIPDLLMNKIYPHILKAADWSWCLGRRSSPRPEQIDVYGRERLNRLGGARCDPVSTVR